MNCSHEGYRAISTSYDRRSGVLVYYWSCEQCGSMLAEAGRQPYRPRFIRKPHEHERQPLAASQ